MRFLIDENLSPALCGLLTSSADSAEHVRALSGSGVPDQAILEHAADRDAVVVTADTDFGTLIARSGRSGPSVILVRELLALTGRRSRALAGGQP